MQVIKRDGSFAKFDKSKIEKAILKAMKYGSGIIKRDIAIDIANDTYEVFKEDVVPPTVYQIEDTVYYALINYGEDLTAKSYEGYRAVQAFKREHNTTDDSILGLIHRVNEEVMNENSNKDATIIPTQRDLIAGEVSKDIARRKLIPTHIVQAHDEGVLHYHDMDYAISPMFNCCLLDIKDMLANGTVINNKLVESPKSFQTACTILTQVIAQVASAQYGGQSVNIKHLGEYLHRSEMKYKKLLKDIISDSTEFNNAVNKLLMKELSAGVQTIQYQINTLFSTNGQSPFVTLFLEIDKENDNYYKYTALIIEEILKQRLEGIKNEKGVYITPAFPKLVYVLDEQNCLKGGEYDYITKVAAKCTAKRLYPDYISAKKMRETYEGNVFSPMGCRSFLSPWKDENGEYKFEGRFNMGVVSLNLPQIGLISREEPARFWDILDKRLELCFEALMIRYNLLKGTISDVSPIHWQYGAIARLDKGEAINKLLENGYATISLGYIGLYELTKIMTGESHSTKDGQDFALKVLNRLKEATQKWKEETGLGFGLYGTPAESLCYRFAKIDKKRFGSIEDITEKGYYTNSYHLDVRENMNAFDKLRFESQFQPISSGGCISYVEIPNMNKNIEALEKMIAFIYDEIQYAEFNTKSDYCHICGFDGEIIVNDNLEWECPNCHNKDKNKMNVTRRTCGYLGDNFWNIGKTKEIKSRVLHVD
jgi:ribonucleoside-triphosphate reductase